MDRQAKDKVIDDAYNHILEARKAMCLLMHDTEGEQFAAMANCIIGLDTLKGKFSDALTGGKE